MKIVGCVSGVGRFLAAMAVLLLAANIAAAQSAEGTQALLPGQRFAISAEDLPNVRYRADRGDVVAIRRLVDHYLIYEADEIQGVYWLERLGDTGDDEARRNVVEYYTRHSSPANLKHLSEVRSRWGM